MDGELDEEEDDDDDLDFTSQVSPPNHGLEDIDGIDEQQKALVR